MLQQKKKLRNWLISLRTSLQ